MKNILKRMWRVAKASYLRIFWQKLSRVSAFFCFALAGKGLAGYNFNGSVFCPFDGMDMFAIRNPRRGMNKVLKMRWSQAEH